MGVLGLTPFLKTTCPTVLKQIPERLRALSGKTVVIDGTLITQRFHYAPLPHQYRHVLGWYRLAQELRDNGVNALCVFDGKERNLAKAREVARRKEVQRVTIARGGVEKERLGRLQQLAALLSAFESFTQPQRERIAQIISSNIHDLPGEGQIPVVGYHPQDFPSDDVQEAEAETETDFDLDFGICPDLFGGPTESPLSWTSADDSVQLDIPNISDYNLPSPSETFESSSSDFDSFAKALSMLYSQYRMGTSTLATLSPGMPNTPWSSEILMSKSQHRLTQSEGQLWKQLLMLPGSKDSDELSELTKQSEILSLSYDRRIDSPTPQTYAECKSIISAMGIPSVDTTGPFEAEALASSLVLNGYADYVVSEDTDVLVYEAPLLRNVTNRTGPLLAISGAEVRKVLKLSRASYVDFAILLGTDFSERIKNVGPARALKFIREYKTIERVIKHETKYPPRVAKDVYMQQVAMARKVFKTLPPIPENMKDLQTGEPDRELVREMLQMYGLGRSVEVDDWDYQAALAGNYFNDSPSASSVYV
ncbi:PIN domain-like protein [Pleurotus eryngii]|uniref:Exonuclease 1 n=1 Tax=Pleurotus eryngii TaxID=5323 RepID=A0A9P6DF95_PLEER|nr:PIN domain-like protein [Pleurotus eryngii]